MGLRVSTKRRTRVDVAPEERTERINVRVSVREVAMLDMLADAAGVSSADIVRMMIRDAYAAKFGDKVPRAKK
jgi:hypothetical protein